MRMAVDASRCPNCDRVLSLAKSVCECSYDLSIGKIKLSEWQVWFSFSGRINRTTYWLLGVAQLTAVYICIPLLLAVILPRLSPIMDSYDSYVIRVALAIIRVALALMALSLLTVFPWIVLAVSAKRWHDRNRSAWWLLVLAIPLAGLLWTLVELGFLGGRLIDRPNRYGPPQR